MTKQDVDKEIAATRKVVHDYIDGVLSGKIVACRWVKLACQRHLNDLRDGSARGLVFREDKAYHAVKFFSFLKLWKGRSYKGLPFVLAPHNMFAIWVLMGWYKVSDKTRRFRKAYIEMARKGAKALALNTPIPTPDGWSTIGELQTGDNVFDADGNICNVTYTTEIFSDRECYEVEFCDGHKIIADSGHLWETTARKIYGWGGSSIKIPKLRRVKRTFIVSGKSYVYEYAMFNLHGKLHKLCRWDDVDREIKFKNKIESMLCVNSLRETKTSVRTTEQIKNTLMLPITGRPDEPNHCVKLAKPLIIKEKDLPIPSYVLGAWLGDGFSSGDGFCFHRSDSAIMGKIKSFGYKISIYNNKAFTGDYILFNPLGLRTQLRKEGLLHNKHIPNKYLRSSHEQRMELIRGLMDTDGSCDERGRSSFSNRNYKLVKQLQELLLTVGLKPHLHESVLKGKPFYTINFKAHKSTPVFYLQRKLDRQHEESKIKLKSKNRYIRKVTSVPSVPVKCISVDSKDGLFLAGDGFIPTHNSTLAGGLAAYFLIADGEEAAEVYTAAVKREQAKIVWDNVKNLTQHTGFAKNITYLTNKLTVESTNSKCEPLSSDAKSLDGLDTHFASLDELHAHPDSQVHDLVSDSIGARSQPMILIITTAGFNQTGICYETREYLTQILKGTIIDDSFFGMIFTLDTKKDWPDLKEKKEELKDGELHEDDWTNEDIWVKAAPGLVGITENGKKFGIDEKGNPIPGYMTKIEDMRDKSRIARQMPSAQNNFLTKRLNIWTQSENRWIDIALWDANNIRPVTEETCRGRSCVGGIDLSAISDFTVWGLLFPDEEDKDLIDIFFRVWCPEARLFDTKNKYRDQYKAWRDGGYLTVTPGDAIDYDMIRGKIAGYTDVNGIYVPGDKDIFNIQSVSVDRGFQGYEFSQKLDAELGGTEKEPKVCACGMGWVSMNGPCQELERLLLLKKLNHGGNPIARFAADNVSVKINPTGGGKSPNKASSQGKIDPIVVILLGLDRLLRKPAAQTSAYANLSVEEILNSRNF